MAGRPSVRLYVALSGQQEFRSRLRQCSSEVKTWETQLKNLEEEYKGNANSIEALTNKQQLLEGEYESLQRRARIANEALDDSKDGYDKCAKNLDYLNEKLKLVRDAHTKLKESITAIGELEKLNAAYEEQDKTLTSLKTALQEARAALDRMTDEGKEGTDEFKEQEAAVKKLEDSIEELSSEMADNRSTVAQLKKENKESLSIFSDQEKEIKQLEAAINKESEQVKSCETRIASWTGEVNKNRKLLDESSDSLNKNRQYINEAREAADGCATSIDKMGNSAEDAQDKMDVLTDEVRDLKGQLDNMADQNELPDIQEDLNWHGAYAEQVMELLWTIPEKIKDGISAAVEMGQAFEAQMDKVAAISGATGSDFEKLTAKAKEMGATTQFSASQAGEALEYMAMAGWKTDEMVEGLEGVMYLAAAAGSDLGTTSDIVTDALTAFGLSADESGHFADVLAAASSNANTNVEMMGQTFKYVGSVAGSMDYSIEDMAEAIGLLANNGIKSTQAGTALRSIITRLSTDAGASSTHLGALGTLTKELGVEFYNADGSARAFGDVLSDTRVAWANLSDEEATYYGKTIAGQEALSAWMALMNSSQTDIDKLSGAIANCSGSAEAMAAVMSDNLSGSLKLFESATEGLGIAVYNLIDGPAKAVVDFATNAISTVTGWLTPAKTDLELYFDEVQASTKLVAAELDLIEKGLSDYYAQHAKLEGDRQSLQKSIRENMASDKVTIEELISGMIQESEDLIDKGINPMNEGFVEAVKKIGAMKAEDAGEGKLAQSLDELFKKADGVKEGFSEAQTEAGALRDTDLDGGALTNSASGVSGSIDGIKDSLDAFGEKADEASEKISNIGNAEISVDGLEIIEEGISNLGTTADDAKEKISDIGNAPIESPEDIPLVIEDIGGIQGASEDAKDSLDFSDVIVDENGEVVMQIEGVSGSLAETETAADTAKGKTEEFLGYHHEGEGIKEEVGEVKEALTLTAKELEATSEKFKTMLGDSPDTSYVAVIDGVTRQLDILSTKEAAALDARDSLFGMGKNVIPLDTPTAEAMRDLAEAMDGVSIITNDFEKKQITKKLQELSSVYPPEDIKKLWNEEYGILSNNVKILDEIYTKQEAVLAQQAFDRLKEQTWTAYGDAIAAYYQAESSLEADLKRANEILAEFGQESVGSLEELKEAADYFANGSWLSNQHTLEENGLVTELWNITAGAVEATKAIEENKNQVEEAKAAVDEIDASYQLCLEDMGMTTEEAQELTAATEANKEAMQGTAEQVDEASDSMDDLAESEDTASESTEELKKKQEELEKAVEKVTESAVKAQEKELEHLADLYEDLRDDMSKTLEEMLTLNEEYKYAVLGEDEEAPDVGKMQDTLRKNEQDLIEYQKDIKALAALANQDVISYDFLDFIIEQGPEYGATIKAMLADTEKLRSLSLEYDNSVALGAQVSEQISSIKFVIEDAIHDVKEEGIDASEMFDALDIAFRDPEGWKEFEDECKETLKNALTAAAQIGVVFPEELKDAIISGEIGPQDAIDTINGSIRQRLEGLADIAEEGGATLPAGLKEGIENGETDVIDSYNAILDAISNQAGLGAKGYATGSYFIEGVKEAFAEDESASMEIYDEAGNLVEKITETMEEKIGDSETGKNIAANAKAGIEEGKGEVKQAASDMVSEAQGEATNKASEFEQTGKEAGDKTASGIESTEETVVDATKTIMDAAVSTANGYESSFTESGGNIPKWMGTGAKNNTTGLTEKVDGVLSDGANRVSGSEESFKKAGEAITGYIGEGVKKSESLKTSLDICFANARNGLTFTAWENIGANIVVGTARGIANNTSVITTAAQNMAQSAYDSAAQTLGIASPSKKFAEGIGAMIALGVAEGVSDKEKIAIEQVVSSLKLVYEASEAYEQDKSAESLNRLKVYVSDAERYVNSIRPTIKSLRYSDSSVTRNYADAADYNLASLITELGDMVNSDEIVRELNKIASTSEERGETQEDISETMSGVATDLKSTVQTVADTAQDVGSIKDKVETVSKVAQQPTTFTMNGEQFQLVEMTAGNIEALNAKLDAQQQAGTPNWIDPSSDGLQLMEMTADNIELVNQKLDAQAAKPQFSLGAAGGELELVDVGASASVDASKKQLLEAKLKEVSDLSDSASRKGDSDLGEKEVSKVIESGALENAITDNTEAVKNLVKCATLLLNAANNLSDMNINITTELDGEKLDQRISRTSQRAINTRTKRLSVAGGR